MNRREVILGAAAATLAAPAQSSIPDRSIPIVRDYSGLTSVKVDRVVRPKSTREVSERLSKWSGPVSVGGARFSMGGQVVAPDSLHFDLRSMTSVRSFEVNPERRVIRIQAGATWRDIQDVIDPLDLSVSIMQSYSNFSVGGSVGVNCHGRYVNKGPLINSVRALQMVDGSGEVHELTPESELFRGAFGGYGGLGVVTEVELDLDFNTLMRREVKDVELEAYPEFFRSNVASDASVVLHNADLRPPHFDEPRTISWVETQQPATISDRLIPRDRNYAVDQTLLWAVSELPGGKRLRQPIEDKLLDREAVVWRNYEASLDTDSLEPPNRLFSTYLLQEYFIPTRNFLPFAKAMAAVLKRHDVNALNISIRHSPQDFKSILTWAPTNVFSFVLYYKQRTSERASREAEIWTRELIYAALENKGRYYLPYRLHATRQQFEQAYPEIDQFLALKAQVDPTGKFRNLLWDKYL